MTVEDFFGSRRDPDDAPLLDFFGNDHDRPLRTEDLLIRHERDGRPKIWVPENLMIPGPDIEYVADENGDIPEMGFEDLLPGTRVIVRGPMVPHRHAGKQWFYSRPSSWGDVCEDQTMLHKWELRTVVDGFVMQGTQSSTLRLEWASLDRTDPKSFKKQANGLCDTARGLVTTADRQGTAFHALTERYDHGMDVRCPDEYKPHFEEWKRLTRHLKIAELYGEPAIECFVVNDEISCAGTFDRLVRYKPCPVCGGRYYILDLKTGKVLFGQSTIGIQEAIYGNSQKYDIIENGKAGGAYPGLRRPLPEDVCQCRGIVINIPIEAVAAGEQGTFQWVNIKEGWEAAKGIAADMRAFRSSKIKWMAIDDTEPDLLGMIEDAQGREDIVGLWREYRHIWDRDPDFYTEQSSKRLAALEQKAVI